MTVNINTPCTCGLQDNVSRLRGKVTEQAMRIQELETQLEQAKQDRDTAAVMNVESTPWSA